MSVSKLNFEIFPVIKSLTLGCGSFKRFCKSPCVYPRFLMVLMICECSSDFIFSDAASSGEKPICSNTLLFMLGLFLPFGDLLSYKLESLSCRFNLFLWCLIGRFREAVQHINQALQRNVEDSIPVLGITVPQLKDARQNGTHQGEIQRLLTFVETLQVVPKVLTCLIGETANDFLRVS